MVNFHMPRIEEDKNIEERIRMEIIVDAYGEIERALSWYYYLKDQLNFPFKAKCVDERTISPLKKDEQVQVVGMPPEDQCEKEMFVNIKWRKRNFAVPLSQLEGIKVDDETEECIEDWRYWVNRGYEF